MKAKLLHTDSNKDGIFGMLYFDDGDEAFMCTLEHAYEQPDGSYSGKVPAGDYLVVRGRHYLHSGPLEAFEVMGVPGHSGILFHVGNFNRDSDGCILCGNTVVADESGQMLTGSSATFKRFMSHLDEIDEFTLKVL